MNTNFGFFENKKGKDSEAQFSDPSMTEFDKSYRSCSVTFNTGQLKGKDTHVDEKGTAYNPLYYYLAMYRRKDKNDEWGDPILFYPSGYNDKGG